MNYLLFFIYLVLLCWLLTKIKFLKKANLGNRTIIILFLIRIAAGLVNGWLNMYHYAISDAIGFHTEGITEYHLLFSNPREYLLDLFNNDPKNSYGAIFDTTDSFWNNLRSNLIIKLLSLFDVLSNCNFFINILFYNFLVFFGSVSLYRVFIQVFAGRNKAVIFAVFLLPSFLYFTSGIHRDGLIFLAIAFVSFNMFRMLKSEGISLKRTAYIIFNLAMIFLLRNFVLITILPALAAWIIAEKKEKFLLPVFIIVYVFFTVTFFSLKFIHPKLDLPQYVSARQMAFVELGKISTSAIHINPLFPDFRSFFNNTPQALNHTLMRPYITENRNPLYLPSSIEILLYEILFITFIFFPLKKNLAEGFVYFGIFFSLSMFLIIGYTIPIVGALIRYRSIYLPFIITPIICGIDLNKIRAKIYYFKK